MAQNSTYIVIFHDSLGWLGSAGWFFGCVCYGLDWAGTFKTVHVRGWQLTLVVGWEFNLGCLWGTHVLRVAWAS